MEMSGDSKTRTINPVTHIIFDVDGLLLDSERIWTQMMKELLEPFGKAEEFTWQVKIQMMGKKETEAGQLLIDQLQLPLTIEQYITRMVELQGKLMPSATLLPGIRKLINHLHTNNVPFAIATGNSEKEFSFKLKGYPEFFGLFHHRVLSGSDPDVHHGKPAPDCFLVCAERFPDKPDSSKVLVFEDAPNGVDAALAAGMQVVWIPDHGLDKSLRKDQATLTLNSALEFKPEMFGLPPYAV